MKIDQYEEPSQAEVEFGMAVSALLTAFYTKDGQLRDIADKKGREDLIKAIRGIPKEITTNLREEDRKLLKEAIKVCNDTKKEVNRWFCWVIGSMFCAVLLATASIVTLLSKTLH